MKALVLEGKVVDVVESTFPVAPPLEWVECGDDVEFGYLYDGESFTSPPEPEVPYNLARANAYPKVGDQLDAILKWASTMDNLPAELSDIVSQWQLVKEQFSKGDV